MGIFHVITSHYQFLDTLKVSLHIQAVQVRLGKGFQDRADYSLIWTLPTALETAVLRPKLGFFEGETTQEDGPKTETPKHP